MVTLEAGVVGDLWKDLWAAEVGCCDYVGALTYMVVIFSTSAAARNSRV